MAERSRNRTVTSARTGTGPRTGANARGPAGRAAPRRRDEGDRSRFSRAALLGATVALLCILGLMMVLSASSVWAIQSGTGAWLYFQRQLTWVVAGAVVLVGVSRISYRSWRLAVVPLLVVSGTLLLAVMIPAFGVTAGGSSRWLSLGPVVFQPSELAKLAALVFSADLLARRGDRIDDPSAVLRPVFMVVGALAAMILVQPDMGTTLLMVLIVSVILFVGGLRLTKLAWLGAGLAASSILLAKVAPYRWARVSAFLNPGADPSNTGYQVIQSLVALGSGNIHGVGLGASRAKWGFLPNAHTDFIFAILGEELGLLGALLVVALFVVFGVVGIGVALRAPDRFGSLLAAGVTAWIVGQALVNLGGVTGLLPVTGVPLPFVSFGGTSMLMTMAAVGILVNVARAGQAPGRSGRGVASGGRGARAGRA